MCANCDVVKIRYAQRCRRDADSALDLPGIRQLTHIWGQNSGQNRNEIRTKNVYGQPRQVILQKPNPGSKRQ